MFVLKRYSISLRIVYWYMISISNSMSNKAIARFPYCTATPSPPLPPSSRRHPHYPLVPFVHSLKRRPHPDLILRVSPHMLDPPLQALEHRRRRWPPPLPQTRLRLQPSPPHCELSQQTLRELRSIHKMHQRPTQVFQITRLHLPLLPVSSSAKSDARAPKHDHRHETMHEAAARCYTALCRDVCDDIRDAPVAVRFIAGKE